MPVIACTNPVPYKLSKTKPTKYANYTPEILGKSIYYCKRSRELEKMSTTMPWISQRQNWKGHSLKFQSTGMSNVMVFGELTMMDLPG